ncbi:MAG: Crp/Fnr family transcriptional regulator [Spirochaetales bacterium]|nr:Crp/Fnr family transcriptional regulator [Spirochaetales bacterium]
MIPENGEVLKAFKPFSSLEKTDLRKIIEFSTFHSIRKGKVLYYQSDRADTVFFLLKGNVRKIKYRSDETNIILGKGTPGQWLGIAEVLMNSVYLYDVMTEESVEVLAFTTHNFLVLVEDNCFKQLILKELARNLYLLHAQLELARPLHRLIRFILANAVTHRGKYRVNATQETISGAIGVTRETVNKYLNHLRTDGLIRIGRGYLEFDDCNRLETYLA